MSSIECGKNVRARWNGELVATFEKIFSAPCSKYVRSCQWFDVCHAANSGDLLCGKIRMGRVRASRLHASSHLAMKAEKSLNGGLYRIESPSRFCFH